MMKSSAPWKQTAQELAKRLLFHGSIEPWRRPKPTVSGYDGCFWTADMPVIAQIYIPAWGGATLLSLRPSRFSEAVSPDRQSLGWNIAQQLGARADILAEDHCGRATSWRSGGERITYRHIAEHLQSLGYDLQANNGQVWVKTMYKDGAISVVSNSAKKFGRLLMVDAPEDLKIYDIAGDSEPDLTDKQYHKVATFGQAFELGFDAVRINDFCQSPTYGNLGHTSIGFSSQAIDALYAQGRITAIAAHHEDWARGHNGITEAYDAWHFGQVTAALAQGANVPSSVLQSHKAKIDAWLECDPKSEANIVATLDPIFDPQMRSPGSDHDGAPDEHEVQRVIGMIEMGRFEQGAARFSVSPEGKLIASNAECVLEAVRRCGASIPVTANVLDPFGRPATYDQLLYAADYWLDPPKPYAAPQKQTSR